MKNSFPLLSAVLLCCCVLRGADSLAPGGVTFDFGKYPVRRAVKATGQNLLRNGDFSAPGTDLQGEGQTKTKRKEQVWDGCSYVHMAKTEGDSREFLKDLEANSIRKAENGRAVIITRPQAAATWKKRVRVSNRVRQKVTLPDSDASRSFQLSFKLRGQAGKVDTWNHPQIFVSAGANPADKSWKELKSCVSKVLPFSREFQEWRIDFTVPPKTRSIHVDFALYGIGRMEFDDVAVVSMTLSSSVDALNFPCGYFDKLFCFGEGQALPMLFALGCPGKPDRKNLRFELELPQGFEVVSWRNAHPLLARKENVYTFDLTKLPPSVMAPEFNSQWGAVSLLVRSSLKPSPQTFTARYRTRGENFTMPYRELQLQVIPAIRGKRPAKFLSAVKLSTDFNFGSNQRKAVGLLDAAGFNALIGGDTGVKKAAGTFGMRRFSPHGIANGFKVIPGKLLPDEMFRKIDGAPWPGMTCPGAVIDRSESYRKNLLPSLERAFKTGELDAVITNWEPYPFDFRGCFCKKCMTEFAKFAKISVEEATPERAVGPYRAQWIRFRSLRHAGLVKTLHKDIAAIGAKYGRKNASFIPEMAVTSVLPARKEGFAQYAVDDYIDYLPELNLWGPYIYHAPDRPYVYAPGPNLRSFAHWELALKEVLKMTNGKRPKLYTFPHGTLDNPVWFSNPEGTAFEFLLSFMLGWDGAFGYYFPRGGDARYYRVLAEANSRIAEYENVRYEGRDISSSVTLTPVSPFPKENFFTERPGLPNVTPGISKLSLLQHRAVLHKDLRLIMAGNFWISGEVFFKLRLEGLAPAGKYEVALPDRSCGVFSGKELARGILMQCGALRWQFITVKKADRPAQGKVFTQAQMAELMKTRLPGLKKQAAFVAEEYKKQRAAEEKMILKADLSGAKELDANGFKLRIAGERLNVSAPGYTLQIDPLKGGRIVNWKTPNTILFAEPGNFGAGLDCFWTPGQQLRRPWKVTSCAATAAGIAVTLEYTVTADFIPALAGLRLAKRYEFTKEGFTQTTTLANHADDGMNFSFRFHAMPDFLTLRKAGAGTIDFGKVRFKREFFEKMFRFAPPDAVVEKAFPMHKVFQVNSCEAVLQAPWSKTKLKVSFEKEKLQCFVCWDDLKDPGATFEAIFRRVSLHPGKSISYTQKYTVIE
ncbi:MAG: hypothetical protein IJT50_09785 [Lentisphaeria bacterium]|nr:hypothetical protein [Lentisphaeria bacterium]